MLHSGSVFVKAFSDSTENSEKEVNLLSDKT